MIKNFTSVPYADQTALSQAITSALASYNFSAYALLASPDFSGTPKIAGAAIATQTYVTTALGSYATSASITTALIPYAKLASPAMTGTPTVNGSNVVTDASLAAVLGGYATTAALTAAVANASIWTQSLKLSDFTASVKGEYFVDTTAGAVTVTLPAATNAWDKVKFVDVAGNFGVNALTIARNGKLIMRLSEDMVVSNNFSVVELTYVNPTYGWVVSN